MQKQGKDVFKILSIVLAVVIAAGIIGGAVLMFLFDGTVSGSGEKAETTELTPSAPSEKEIKLASEITVSSAGASVTEEQTGGDEEDAGRLGDDYILPESNSRLLTESDIEGLSLRELNYAKNEIYARHGRKFKSQELQDYFESKSWYEGRYEGADFDENYSAGLLSEIEKKNAEFLKAAEEEMSSGGYQLDQ